MSDYIRIAIEWGPTFIFALIALFGIIDGIIKGLRKSIISLISVSISLFIVFLVYSLIVSNTDFIDKNTVSLVNYFMQKFNMGTIQDALHVDSSLTSVTEIAIKIILNSSTEAQKYEFLMVGASSYVALAADMVYHVVALIVIFPLYFICRFILYIIYLIFFKEGRRKKKIKKLYDEGQIPNDYSKKRFGGALIGCLHGCIHGIIIMSFVGSLLFIFFGTGENDRNDLYFGNEYDDYYDIYKSASSYGETGIFQILNDFSDENDEPYYFLIADVILSANIDDKEHNYTSNVIYRKELNTYISFAEETLDLIIKYKPNAVKDIVNTMDTAKIQGLLTDLLNNRSFMREFKGLVENFETNTLFINLSVSLIDTIARDLKTNAKALGIANSIPEAVYDIIDVLFGENGIKPSDLITPEDIKSLLCTAIDLSTDIYQDISVNKETNVVEYISKYGSDVIEGLSKMSMFSSKETITKGNRVLNNLYSYVATSLRISNPKYTKVDMELIKGDYSITDVDFLGELKYLDVLLTHGLNIYNNNFKDGFSLEKLLNIFNSEKNNLYINNIYDYSCILDAVGDSSLLGALLGTYVVQDYISLGFSNIKYLSDYVLPQNIQFTNSKANKGEMYNLLFAFKTLLLNNPMDLINTFTASDVAPAKMLEDISNFLTQLVDDKTGKNATLADVLFDSEIMISLVSKAIPLVNDTLNKTEGSIKLSIYIPEECYSLTDVYGNNRLINKSDLIDLTNSLSTITEIYADFTADSNPLNILVKDEDKLLEIINNSKIIEGTVSNLVYNTIISNSDIRKYMILTEGMGNIESWLKSNNSLSEIESIIKVINNSKLDILSALSNGNFASLTDKLKNMVLTDDNTYSDLLSELELISSSRILNYTVTNILTNMGITTNNGNTEFTLDSSVNAIRLYIPNSSLLETHDMYYIYDSSKNTYTPSYKEMYVINPTKLVEAIALLRPILDSLSDYDKLVSYLVNNLDDLLNNDIIHATLIGIMPNVIETLKTSVEGISIPKNYLSAINKASLRERYSDNIWVKNNEIKALFDGLDEIANIRQKCATGSFEVRTLGNDVTSSVSTLFEKPKRITGYDRTIDVLYNSEILKQSISGVLSTKIDETLSKYSEIQESESSYYLIKENEIKSSIDYYQTDGAFTIADIEKLLTALEIFDITFNDLINSNINYDNVITKLFKLNDIADSKYQDSTGNLKNIDIVYESTIFSLVLSNIMAVELSKNLASTLNSDIDKLYNSLAKIEYKSSISKAEFINLLNALDVLEIKALDDFNHIDAEKLLFSMDDNINGKTKIDIIYSSNIISTIISKFIDNSLISNELVNNQILLDSIKVNNIYSKSELKTFINIIKYEFKLQSFNDISSFDYSNLIFRLEDFSDSNPRKRIKEVLFESSLMSVLFTETIENLIIDSELVDNTEFMKCIKANGLLTMDNVTNLVNVLKEVGITSANDFSSFDGNEALDLIFTFDQKSKVDPSVSRIDIIYKDSFTSALFSNILDNMLITSKIITDRSILDSIKNKYGGIYSRDEVLALAPSLKVIGITSDNYTTVSIDSNSILLDLLKPNKDDSKKTNLDVIYESKLITSILSTEFENLLRQNNLRGDFIEFFKDSDNIAIKEEVIYQIIDILTNSLKIKSFDNLYFEDLFDILLEENNGITKLEELYNPLDGKYYGALFIREFIRAEIDVLSYKDIFDESFSEDKDKAKLIYIEDVYTNHYVSNEIGELGYYDVYQIKKLIKLIQYIEENSDLPIYNSNEVLGDDSFARAIKSTPILRRFMGVLACFGYDNEIFLNVPSTVYDSKLKTVADEELDALIDGIEKIGSMSATNIQFTDQVTDAINKSYILRATLTMNISFVSSSNVPNKLYVEYSNNVLGVESIKRGGAYIPFNDINNERLFCLTEDEFTKLVNAFKVLGVSTINDLTIRLPGSINTIIGYEDTKLQTLLASSIIRNYVSEFLLRDDLALKYSTQYGQTFKLAYNSNDFSTALKLFCNPMNPKKIPGLTSTSFTFTYLNETRSIVINDYRFPSTKDCNAYNINQNNRTMYYEKIEQIEDINIIAFIKFLKEVSNLA